LEIERAKWFISATELMKIADQTLAHNQSHVKADLLDGMPNCIIKSFQVVHVLSFAHAQQYVGDKIGDFTRSLCARVFEADWDQSQPHVHRYTELKERFQGDQFHEQFLKFSEDLSLAITGGPMGMLLAPAIDAIVVDFYYRNLLLVARVFDDQEMGAHLFRSIRQLHERS
jgi:hypothetical protein